MADKWDEIIQANASNQQPVESHGHINLMKLIINIIYVFFLKWLHDINYATKIY